MSYKMRDPGRSKGIKGWDESQHPRAANGQFGAGESVHVNGGDAHNSRGSMAFSGTVVKHEGSQVTVRHSNGFETAVHQSSVVRKGDPVLDPSKPLERGMHASALREHLVDHVANGGKLTGVHEAHLNRLAAFQGRAASGIARAIRQEGRMQGADEKEGPDGMTDSERAHFRKR